MDFNLNLLAQIVGNSFGITVQNGSGFAIGKNGNGLVLFVPPMRIGTEEDAAVLRGGLCHEAVGHGRHTDFDAKRGPTPLHMSIENVLEDARIEKAAWAIYPKTRRILDESMAVMTKRNMIKRASNQSTPPEKAAIAVLLRLMVEELGYCKRLINWKVDWAEAVQCFGDETMNKVWVEAVRGYQMSSTEEVIRVSAVIVKLLQQGFKDQQQSDGGDQEQSEGEAGDDQSCNSGNSDSSGEGQKGQKGQEQGDDSGESQQESSSGKGKDSKNASSGSSKGNGRTSTPLDTNTIKPAEFDRGDLLKSQIPKAPSMCNIKVSEAHSFGPFKPSGDSKAAAQRLKSSLAQRLLAVVEDEDDDLVECGVLASNRLVDARMGDRYVFAEPGKPGERLDTAFSLLIDMSGSMGGVSDEACLAATWAIGDTLNGYSGMGLSFTVSSFNSHLYEMKGWNKPWKRGECLSFYGAGGGTNTYGAVKDRLEHLVKRKEARKVLYLITDGDIGDLSSLVHTAREMETEIVVMMIGDERSKPDAPYLKRFGVVQPGNIAREMLKTVISLF